jgi:hypothetical protein
MDVLVLESVGIERDRQFQSRVIKISRVVV